MGRDFSREVPFEKSRPRWAAKGIFLALSSVLVLGSDGVAKAQVSCTACVKKFASYSNDTGPTAANTLDITVTVPSSVACPNAMLVAAVSITNHPDGAAPSLTGTSGATWDEDADGSATPTNMTYEGESASYSDNLNDSQNLRSEIWTLANPTPGTNGRIRLTLTVGNTARMVGGGVVLCGVYAVAHRSGFNNQQVATLTYASLEKANGRMFMDNCAVNGDLSAQVTQTYMAENWNRASGVNAEDIHGMSSVTAMTAAPWDSSVWSLGSTPTYYACSAISFTPTSPTSVGLETFSAKAFRTGVYLSWSAGQEADNLGYRLFRDDDGERVQVTPELVVGSALSYPGSPLQAGYSYGWWDPSGKESSRYWLADVELGGQETLHGPFNATAGTGDGPPVGRRMATPISRIGEIQNLKAAVQAPSETGIRPILGRPSFQISETNRTKQLALAAGEAAKIVVRREGWYRFTGADLAAAGVAFLGSDPESLKLYVNGAEQAIRVNDGGDRAFDAGDSIEFYGVPLDTQWAGTQTYWLVRGGDRGERIPVHGQAVRDGEPVTTTFTAETKERLFYAGGVLNGEVENFFGKAVTTTATEMYVGVPALDVMWQGAAQLDVALQGFSEVAHEVNVSVNGRAVGVVPFAGKEWKKASFPIPPSALSGGMAAISFKEAGNDRAVSAVDYVRITYPRVSRAQGDILFFSMRSADVEGTVRITGFTGPNIRVFDVTAPSDVSEIRGSVPPDRGLDPSIGGTGYSIDIAPLFVRWNGPETVRHFLAVADSAVMRPDSITANQPSTWARSENEADYIAIAHRSLISTLAELRSLREAQGLKVAIIDVEDVYDEFGFGVKSPQAIREFLRNAVAAWKVKPRFVLLVGDASQDPKDYLRLGQDLVPTKLIDTKRVETASDDWMADIDGDGKADVALGRLPAATESEAAAMVSKIVRREKAARGLQEALLVADTAEVSNFAEHNRELRGLLPSSVSVAGANADELGDEATRNAILQALTKGVDLVHYSGHGTIDHWRGNLLSVDDVPSLGNFDRFPIFTVTNCLTGIFQEPLMQGLGEVLMKAPDGGAVAVWASSGTTSVPGQEVLMKEFLKSIFVEGGVNTLGEAARSAKASVIDADVRNTWILLGDPATRIR